ncbi:hypothetical protein FISHEDRAFT_36711 [Fistulina hepatica ATCC 64428]|uniref:Aminoglycoside phosphotransferase domain-containing protein n=1 Tax=Fistulina hepatica ATCC 64428 TaxID=1128425 RepID=A0A0D7ALD4_9AGAR|nr:hypothetical protein FISHEDRAFT_36711 [Fistulina hepatica ATCC 64428]
MASVDTRPIRTIAWESTLWGTQPHWTCEPCLEAIEQIARQHLEIPSTSSCAVALFAQGGFNKIYIVDSDAPRCTYLLRVSLPVEPQLKTLSEVATIAFVAEHSGYLTLLPIVLAYEANREAPGNSLGFEWMLMSKLPGSVLDGRWASLTLSTKERLVKTLVAFLANLFNHTLSGIGNIYPHDYAASSASTPPVVGPIVSMTFFWNKHYEQNVPRGPFNSSHAWLSTCLTFVLDDAAETLRTSDDEDDLEEAESTQSVAERLARLLPRVFSPFVDKPERTVLHHDDLSFHNLLVDDAGQLSGIVDWECVSTLPLWRTCQLPSFLVGPCRAEQPARKGYMDDEGGVELYHEHLRQWEQTHLRTVFFAEMDTVCPAWMHEHRASMLREDLYTAIQYCDNEISRTLVRRWSDRVEGMAEEQMRDIRSSAYESLTTQLKQS